MPDGIREKAAGHDRPALAGASGPGVGHAWAWENALATAAGSALVTSPYDGAGVVIAQALPAGDGSPVRSGAPVVPLHRPGPDGRPNLRVLPGQGKPNLSPPPATPVQPNVRPAARSPQPLVAPSAAPGLQITGGGDGQAAGNALIPARFLIANNLYANPLFPPAMRFDAMVTEGLRAARSGGNNQGTTVHIAEDGTDVILRYDPRTGMVSQQLAGQGTQAADYMPLAVLAAHHRLSAAGVRGQGHGNLATALEQGGSWPANDRQSPATAGVQPRSGIARPDDPIIRPSPVQPPGLPLDPRPAPTAGPYPRSQPDQALAAVPADWHDRILPAIDQLVSRHPAWLQSTFAARIAHYLDGSMPASARSEQAAMAWLWQLVDTEQQPDSPVPALRQAAIEDWHQGARQMLDHVVREVEPETRPYLRVELERWLQGSIGAGQLSGTLASISAKLTDLASSPVAVNALFQRAMAARQQATASDGLPGQQQRPADRLGEEWTHPDSMPATEPQAPYVLPSVDPENPQPAQQVEGPAKPPRPTSPAEGPAISAVGGRGDMEKAALSADSAEPEEEAPSANAEAFREASSGPQQPRALATPEPGDYSGSVAVMAFQVRQMMELLNGPVGLTTHVSQTVQPTRPPVVDHASRDWDLARTPSRDPAYSPEIVFPIPGVPALDLLEAQRLVRNHATTDVQDAVAGVMARNRLLMAAEWHSDHTATREAVTAIIRGAHQAGARVLFMEIAGQDNVDAINMILSDYPSMAEDLGMQINVTPKYMEIFKLARELGMRVIAADPENRSGVSYNRLHMSNHNQALKVRREAAIADTIATYMQDHDVDKAIAWFGVGHALDGIQTHYNYREQSAASILSEQFDVGVVIGTSADAERPDSTLGAVLMPSLYAHDQPFSAFDPGRLPVSMQMLPIVNISGANAEDPRLPHANQVLLWGDADLVIIAPRTAPAPEQGADE